MIADIEDGKIDTVITKDLSRLGRNYLESGAYIEVFSRSAMYAISQSMTVWIPSRAAGLKKPFGDWQNLHVRV